MQVRPIQEADIEQVIRLFQANYGDDYSMPEFYDPQWVKRGVYSDHIIWLVIEDEGRIVANGACILNVGDYNDLIGEVGRVVVDPDSAGKGLGGMILSALIAAADERVEFAFAEARTVHPRTQKINDHIGMAALGFLPMHYRMHGRESLVLQGQLFGNGRSLRRPGTVEVIPPVAPLARLSLRNLHLDEQIRVREDVRGYPIDQGIAVAPLTASSLVRLLRLETGRVLDPEIFGGMHVDEGLPQLNRRKASYLVASEGERTLGAVGYLHNTRNQSVRLVELIAQDDFVKGSLLRQVVDRAEQELRAEVIECDVVATSPRMQQTLLDMGFLPTSFVPGMVFHRTSRVDIVKMAKLNVPWDLGPIELTPRSHEYFCAVTPAFERASAERASRTPMLDAPLLKGFTPLEVYLFQRACEEIAPDAGAELPADALLFPLAGSVYLDARPLEPGAAVGAGALLGNADGRRLIAGENARLLALRRASLDRLCEQHPRLGVKLYQSLAACPAS